MSVESLAQWLRDSAEFTVPYSADDPRYKAADKLEELVEKLEELAAEVERCHRRLEIDRCFVLNEAGDDLIEKPIPMAERAEIIDGIEARDVTIREQDEQLSALRKWRQEYVGKLTIAEAALAEKDKEIAALREERDFLQEILDARPAINAALPESYIRWSQSLYSGEAARASLKARNAGGKDV